MHMIRQRSRPVPKPVYGRHFLREWREYRGYTLEAVGEAVGISHGQLGRIERRLQPYNQGLLEALADLYQTDPASLVMRNPADAGAIWSLWDQAKEGQRQQIQEFADFVVNKRA